jgi:hypothetical protein
LLSVAAPSVAGDEMVRALNVRGDASQRCAARQTSRAKVGGLILKALKKIANGGERHDALPENRCQSCQFAARFSDGEGSTGFH